MQTLTRTEARGLAESSPFCSSATTLCISIARKPGRFGATVHNAGFRALGLDFFYRACAVEDLAGAMHGIRALGIRGCSVSMPFKVQVLDYLDVVTPQAVEVGAVNTIVQQEKKLIGYNTDVSGARAALATCQPSGGDRAIILGAGGVARAIVVACKQLGIKRITVCARREEEARKLAQRFDVHAASWNQRETISGDILINATPIGMSSAADMPVNARILAGFHTVMDAVVSIPHGALLEAAKTAGAKIADGATMALHQALEQFRLYTGHEPPVAVMQHAVQEVLAATI